MNDLISRLSEIRSNYNCLDETEEPYYRALSEAIQLASVQPEQAVKDCRNCKHGKYNDYHDTYFCYNAEDCSNWDKWETSAQPEIIHCKECRHNGSFDTDCPIDWNGKEYCSFAER